jgi:hypothetical protein
LYAGGDGSTSAAAAAAAAGHAHHRDVEEFIYALFSGADDATVDAAYEAVSPLLSNGNVRAHIMRVLSQRRGVAVAVAVTVVDGVDKGHGDKAGGGKSGGGASDKANRRLSLSSLLTTMRGGGKRDSSGGIGGVGGGGDGGVGGGDASATKSAAATLPSDDTTCLSLHTFATLTRLLRAVLDCCSVANDYECAAALSLCGNAFYVEDAGGFRKFIEAETRTHPFWHKPMYWTMTLASHVTAAEKARGRAFKRGGDGDGAGDGDSGHGDDGDGDALGEVVVSWMVQSCHVMISNGLGHRVVADMMRRLAVTYALNDARRTLITDFLTQIARASALR